MPPLVSPEKREIARRVYVETGSSAKAAVAVGVHTNAVSVWARRYGWVSDLADATDLRRLRWADALLEEAEHARDVAWLARVLCAEQLEAGDSLSAGRTAVVYGIMFDKAQLASGLATQRSENATITWTPDQRLARLRELEAEGRALRAARTGMGGATREAEQPALHPG